MILIRQLKLPGMDWAGCEFRNIIPIYTLRFKPTEMI